MLQAVGENSEGQGLGFCRSLLERGAVSHHARELKDLGDPAAVFFLFNLDMEVHVAFRGA